MTAYIYPPNPNRIEQAGKWASQHESPEWLWLTALITQIVSWVGAVILWGFIIWGQDNDWVPALWMPLLLMFDVWPVFVGEAALERVARRRALPIPSGDYKDGNLGAVVKRGARAFDHMPPILREGTAPAYATMYKALGRYQVANETSAIEAAAKRGQLLIDVAAEGVLTRAAQIDISDESDLHHGREIVQEMQMMRRELEG